jgi:competence protein ComEA
MKNSWKAYFIFSDKELKAIVVIGAFIVVSTGMALLFPAKKKTIQLFYFDPNTLDSISAMNLGIQPRQFSTLSKFRKKGGRFYKKEDILKWYGVSVKVLEQLLPYVRITAPKLNRYKYAHSRHEYFTLDINKADSLQLVVLGIRPYMAARIIQYRDYLGGFSSNTELKKVYGLRDSLYNLLLPNLSKKPGPKPKMHWETMNYMQLVSLGLFERREIGQILKQRKEEGVVSRWVAVVAQFDLSREQAMLLRERTDIR